MRRANISVETGSGRPDIALAPFILVKAYRLSYPGCDVCVFDCKFCLSDRTPSPLSLSLSLHACISLSLARSLSPSTHLSLHTSLSLSLSLSLSSPPPHTFFSHTSLPHPGACTHVPPPTGALCVDTHVSFPLTPYPYSTSPPDDLHSAVPQDWYRLPYFQAGPSLLHRLG